LRFTAHELSVRGLTSILTFVFDTAYRGSDGSIYHGPTKITFFVSNEITSSRIGLPHGPLRDLLYGLTETFAVRYTRPPTEREEQFYQKFCAKFSLDELLELADVRVPVRDYHDRQERLETSAWMHARFKQAAESTNWPTGTNQRIVHNLEYPNSDMLKRKQEDEVNDRQPRRQPRRQRLNEEAEHPAGIDVDEASEHGPGNL
jgi:hypothetical protein